ncbi:MAG: putative Cyanophycinase [Candidatus Thorarchaeota archaeon]|nr:MAG: putative Cyanophycinase [Candidatus Thorarchaeota archaeon]
MKTRFVLIGGNEDHYPEEPLFLAISENLDYNATLLIVPTASGYPESTSKTYRLLFRNMGFSDVQILDVLNRDDSYSQKNIRKVEECDAIFFVGGDQSRLTRNVRGTDLHTVFRERIQDGIIVGGTSAGAMALSEKMIAGGSPGHALRKGEVNLSEGLGILPHLVIDTHMITRNRYWRLVHALAEYPDKIGIGISNDTGVMIEDTTLTTLGTDLVAILRGDKIVFNNSPKIDESERIGVGPLNCTILPAGYSYSLDTQEIQEADLTFPYTHK